MINRRKLLAFTAGAGAATVLAPVAALASSRHHRRGADIVDIAAGNDDFSTLVAAVQAAGLVDTLKGAGPFTVFAPTNAAFDALPHGTVENLLRPENRDALVNVLTYHVVPGIIRADMLTGRRGRVAMVNGQFIRVDGRHGVRINGSANVTATDIQASNGLIHVIDKVLLPS
ncbi:MAG: fasciclin domain-containing protein [Pararhodobacter sp.]